MNSEISQFLELDLDAKIAKTKEIMKQAIDKYPKIGLAFSGGSDSLVLLHLILPDYPDLPVVFINTQHQFPETHEFIKKVREELNIKNFYEFKADENKFDEFKEKLGFKTAEFIAQCCDYHKIKPLLKSVEVLKLDALVVALRGDEHEERAKETIFSPREDHVRIHPLLFWKQKDILNFIKLHNLHCNPLYSQGYTSLGCLPCTEKNLDPDAHERVGRGKTRELIMKRLRELGYT